MIIVELNGGLGNQLFQYSLGRHLALKNRTNLIIETINFDINIRKYSLDFFKISGKSVKNYNLESNTFPNIHKKDLLSKIQRRLYRIKESILPSYKQRLIIENEFNFNNKILAIRNSQPVYLIGNWQSEKYFIDIADIIRKEFSLKDKLSEKASGFLNEIKNTESSVSIHIRRGDYISNKKTNSFHGTCSLDYYKKATDTIEKTVTSPKYFIFSDDVEWVKNNLKLNFPAIYISGNNIPDYEEMILMSKCKHNIIANSSFSWWGAWLNNNPNKIVIAPKKWFNNTTTETKDLIPDSWIKI